MRRTGTVDMRRAERRERYADEARADRLLTDETAALPRFLEARSWRGREQEASRRLHVQHAGHTVRVRSAIVDGIARARNVRARAALRSRERVRTAQHARGAPARAHKLRRNCYVRIGLCSLLRGRVEDKGAPGKELRSLWAQREDLWLALPRRVTCRQEARAEDVRRGAKASERVLERLRAVATAGGERVGRGSEGGDAAA